MMLADLLTTLETQGALKPSRAPAMKTSPQVSGARPRPRGPGGVPRGRRLKRGSHVGESAGGPLAHAGDAGEGHQRVHQTQLPQRYPQDLQAGRGQRAPQGAPAHTPAREASDTGLPAQSRARPRPTRRRIGPQIGPHRFTLPQDAWPPDIQAGFRTTAPAAACACGR